MTRALALAVLALTPTALAQPDVRTQSCSAIIAAPVEQVWAAFTTEAGMEAWMVPTASIDLRVGGQWRTSYNPASTLDDADTIVHTIIAYEPMRMLATTTRPPESARDFFGDVDFSQLWGVMRFEPLDASSTRITITGLGYGEGEAWDKVLNFFATNNPLVLEELARHLTPDAPPHETGALNADSQKAMDLLHRLAGGEWLHESTPPGSNALFRVRNTIEKGPDGVSLTSRGWLGDATAMHPHSAAIIRRSLDGTIRFENVSETGDVAAGEITLLDADSIKWDWNVTTLAGQTSRFEVQMDFPADPDTYQFTLYGLSIDDAGVETKQQLVSADFHRVQPPHAEARNATTQPQSADHD